MKRDFERLTELKAAQQRQAAAYFAEVAAQWDELRRLHVPELAVEQAVVAAMQGRVVDTLIDLGTGTGRMLELLAPLYRRGMGIDQSREMLAIARDRLKAAGIAHAEVRLGDVTRLDAGLGRADIVVLHQVLHYFDDPGRVVAAARGLLQPGGRLFLIDYAAHDLEFLRREHAHRRLGLADEQLAGWARAAGLAVARRVALAGAGPGRPDGLPVGARRSDLAVGDRLVTVHAADFRPSRASVRPPRPATEASSSFRRARTRRRRNSGRRSAGWRRSGPASCR